MNINSTLTDAGLLFIRVSSASIMMILHGWGKITGGTTLWTKLGNNMPSFGLDFMPPFWGFMSAVAEFVVPVLLILGVLFRPAAFLLAFNMGVALHSHFGRLDPWNKIELALLFFSIAVGLLITGPGRFSIDALRTKNRIQSK